jgi:hypothetical protein
VGWAERNKPHPGATTNNKNASKIKPSKREIQQAVGVLRGGRLISNGRGRGRSGWAGAPCLGSLPGCGERRLLATHDRQVWRRRPLTRASSGKMKRGPPPSAARCVGVFCARGSPEVAIDAVSASLAAMAKGSPALNRQLAPPTATKRLERPALPFLFDVLGLGRQRDSHPRGRRLPHAGYRPRASSSESS